MSDPYRMAPGMVGAEAIVTPLQPVDGTGSGSHWAVKRAAKRTRRNGPVYTLVDVDDRVFQAARNACRPGERIVIVSATEVRLVPSR